MSSKAGKETKVKKPSFLENIKRFIKTISRIEVEGVKASRGLLAVAQFIVILIAAVPFFVAYAFKLVVDEVIRINSQGISWQDSNLKYYLALSVLAQFLYVAISSLNGFFEKHQYLNFSKYFTSKFLEKSASLDLYHYQNPKSSATIRKAKEQYEWKLGDTVWNFSWFMESVFTFGLSLTIIANFSPPIVLLMVAAMIPLLYVNIKRANTNWGIWDTNVVDRMKFYGTADYLSNESTLVELKTFRTPNYLLSAVKDIYERFTNKELDAHKRLSIYDFLANTVSLVGTIAFTVYTIGRVINGQITIGDLSFYLSVQSRFTEALGNLFRRFSRVYENSKYVEEYYNFIDLKNKIVSGDRRLDVNSSPTIEFRNVGFKYPGEKRFVLRNFNLKVEPGERVAFVGENGAGKSTIIKLMTRFYDATEGEILVDGINVKELELDSLYRKISMLTQDFAKYNFLDVKGNIGIGDIDKVDDIEHIKMSAKKSGADKFIEKFKTGYDQLLSKKFDEGTELSGGQWQRIALARGFFKDAQILILDEPTSAIDAKGEFEIFERLYEFTKGKSVIIVSHRFSTVRMADKIYVVDQGQIAESGTHEELMELGKIYAEAFNTQAKGYK